MARSGRRGPGAFHRPDRIRSLRTGTSIALRLEERRLRWADLAAINGRVAHPLMELQLIATPRPGYGPSPWTIGPGGLGGPLPQSDRRELANVLSRFTTAAELCWYCVWSGYGGIEETETGAQVHLCGRDYFLSSGPIDDVTSFEAACGPEVWWPDDRAWCVGHDIDLDASYVGGSAECIDAILASEVLEALPVSPDDRVDEDADAINRASP